MNSIYIICFFALTIFFGCTMAHKTATNPQEKAIVYTTFVVDTLGNVTNVKVLQVDCIACPDSSIRKMIKEASEVVSNQPKWRKVGRDSYGNKVSVRYNLPISFDKTKY